MSRDDILFCLSEKVLFHNHKLILETKGLFTAEILEEIDKLKCKTKTIKNIQDLINKKFSTKFDYPQIVYQVNKLLNKSFGTSDNDAINFLQAIIEDVTINGGYYDYQSSGDNSLQKILYVSSKMKKLSENF